MSNFICAYDYGHRHGNLNMRQLLNPIFFEPVARHPDHRRQRGMRLRARSLRQARELKALGSTWIPELPGTEFSDCETLTGRPVQRDFNLWACSRWTV